MDSLFGKIIASNNIQVISYSLTTRWGNRDSAICKEWHPPAQSELISLIRKLKPTTAVGDYEAHSDLSCNIEGKLSIDNDIYDYELNAGGYITLHKQGIDVRLCTGHDTALAQYFLSIESDTDNFK